MKVELFTLCDYVSNNEGSLTIIDTFETIEADKFPWRAYFGVALKVYLSNPQSETLKLNMHIHKSDSTDNIFNAMQEMRIKDAHKMVMAGNIKGLIFDTPGLYHFVVSLEDKSIVDYAFLVKQSNNGK